MSIDINQIPLVFHSKYMNDNDISNIPVQKLLDELFLRLEALEDAE